MHQLLRANPGLLVWVLIFGICTLVCTVAAILVSRSGGSLRPIYWFGGLILLFGLPQFLAHLYLALSAQQSKAPRIAAMQKLASDSTPETHQKSARLLFGEDADADLVIDARAAFGEALAKAEVARFASLPTGETVLLARFGGYSDAERAWFLYLEFTGLNKLGGKGDSQRGYAVTRPVGDRAYALHMSDMLGVWTGRDDATIRQRMQTGGFEIPRRAPLGAGGEPQPSSAARADLATNLQSHGGINAESNYVARRPAADTNTQTKMSAPRIVAIASGLALYLLLVVLYFFKGAAWAGSSPARTLAKPIPAAELVSRLEAINALDVPFRIDRSENDPVLVATWRYADGKWIDLARAHGIRRLHRIKLALDPSSHTVRATDFAASYDWSAGGTGASVEWKMVTGITFFHYEHRRVFGLQLDRSGGLKPELSYAYTFNLQEMKGPLIDAVTSSGWSWRPVAWQGPKWLRWLTE
jgi:hypothetical protein